MIIGLSGKKGSGKDTVAEYLCAQYGFINYGFGDPIKEIARIMFQFSQEQLHGNQKDVLDNRWGFKPRDFFQKFGTEYGQFILPEHFPSAFLDIDKRQFWVKCFWNWYVEEKKQDPYLRVVISDVRFLHEFNFLQEKGAYLIKIKRHTDNLDRHISENELDILRDEDYNGIINNSSSKEELYQQIREMLN